MRKGVLLLLVLLAFLSARANNVQLNETVKIVSATGSLVTMEVNLSWENSWRDEYNWDAVWLFFKYKVGVDGAWQHATINTTGATVTAKGSDYTTMSATTGATAQGLFICPSKSRVGSTDSLKVRVQWSASHTEEQFKNNDVFIVAHGIEMVYIPYGTYTIGDGSSAGSFDKIPKAFYGLIPESSDVVNNTSGYVITASAQDGASVATNAADHLNSSVFPIGSWYSYPSTSVWWKIDFKTSKVIRYFGISGAASSPNFAPTGEWYFEGSNDNVNWTRLSVFSPGVWRANAISYPVQESLRVDKPGAYRYYRVNFPSSYYSVVQNIAMTEDELCVDCSLAGNFVDDESSRAYSAGGNTFTLPDAFPKGYQGFYVMKYETSQEQYVEFINALTLPEQKALIPGVDALGVGDFVFGSNKNAPNCRNSIILSGKIADKPLLFDSNLNNNKVYSEDGDGGTLAMNYISITDACGYASWAGLRPMTEMEYEKACRRPYPQEPEAGEFAWNSASEAVNASGLTMQGSGREITATGNVNAGGTINGPVRCGIFARPSTANQAAAGATYWGVMEMSGNVSELCATITNTTISKTGNGTGAYNASLFGIDPTNYGTRGGGFIHTHLSLTTSSRDAVSCFTNALQRDSTVGFRCVSTYAGESGVNAGTISFSGNVSAVCPGETITIANLTDANAGDFSITGYAWYINGATVPDAVETSLTLNNVVGGQTYSIVRKAVCPLGEASTAALTIKVIAPKPLAGTITGGSRCGVGEVAIRNATPASVECGFPITYSWWVSGKEIAGQQGESLTHTFTAYGSIPVIRRATAGTIADATTTVTVTSPAPKAGSITAAIKPRLINTPVTIANGSLGSVGCGSLTYRWFVNGAAVAGSGSSLTYTFTSLGTFTVIRRTTAADGAYADAAATVSVVNCGAPVSDSQGNGYTTKEMADNRCWMTQNMRRTDVAYYAYPNNDPSNAFVYGCVYDWPTAMQGSTREGARGICPVGWHIPTDGEWKALEMAYGMTKAQADGTGWRGTNQGTQFKVGGSSGFNMTLSGNQTTNFGIGVSLWSSSASGAGAWRRHVIRDNAAVNRDVSSTTHYPARCIRD